MESNFDSPVSTLKVDFGCSRDCPTDVKNMLEQLKGVQAISIDPNEGKVTVVGNVNPMMLIKLLQKMGKKAQLWSFDKAPQQKGHGSHPKMKQTSSHCCVSSESEDSSDTDVHWKHRTSKKKHSKKKHQSGYADKYAAPQQQPPFTGYHHPAMPGYRPPFAGGYHQPMHGYPPFRGYHPPMQGYHQPFSGYARPPVHNYGYYGQVQPNMHQYPRVYPQHSPMVHYNSYADNYRW